LQSISAARLRRALLAAFALARAVHPLGRMDFISPRIALTGVAPSATSPFPDSAGRATAGEAVRISVQDSGPGIPPNQRERIFERFAQGEEPGAAGLGLAIVRDVVQAHGGRIYLESELGRGSRFTIELPA
jgi:signal transduction histidine kinase